MKNKSISIVKVTDRTVTFNSRRELRLPYNMKRRSPSDWLRYAFTTYLVNCGLTLAHADVLYCRLYTTGSFRLGATNDIVEMIPA
jgi:hypothetical protein